MKKEGNKIAAFELGDRVFTYTSRLGVREAYLEAHAVEVLNEALRLRAKKKESAYRSMTTSVMLLPERTPIDGLMAKAIIDWNEQGMENERGAGLA